MSRFEYKVIKVDALVDNGDDKQLETLLNSLGTDGWELVTVLDQVYSGFAIQPRACCNHIILKREL
ncbi:MAG: DUF4177 domain-containing protein [Oscillospiraceae bacterium]|jgi:hypothetical protein|nr:DUF4177 domain-containing protein [Oscillospiraceae bacterium]